MTDPVDKVVWKDADSLEANGWNPNYILDPELKLLERSILTNGWIQPIIVTPIGTIVDGFHRWQLARSSKALRAKYGGRVPVVILEISEPEAMMLTVRINRAKGRHAALRMGELVRKLIAEGVSVDEISAKIGATIEEVELLSKPNVFEARNIPNYRYSRSWSPKGAIRRKPTAVEAEE